MDDFSFTQSDFSCPILLPVRISLLSYVILHFSWEFTPVLSLHIHEYLFRILLNTTIYADNWYLSIIGNLVVREGRRAQTIGALRYNRGHMDTKRRGHAAHIALDVRLL